MEGVKLLSLFPPRKSECVIHYKIDVGGSYYQPPDVVFMGVVENDYSTLIENSAFVERTLDKRIIYLHPTHLQPNLIRLPDVINRISSTCCLFCLSQ